MNNRIIMQLKVGDKNLVVYNFLDLPLEDRLRNIHCFDSKGQLLWKIPRWQLPADVDMTTDFFTRHENSTVWIGVLKTSDGQIRAFNQLSFSVALSLEDGSISDFRHER